MSEASHILVVDDEPGTRETLRDILELKGHTVRTATSGRAGLETLVSSPIDAVIVDLKLPDVSGLDLLEAIKATSAETEVIVITGHASVASAVQAINGAAFGYLTKPFDVRQLVATLDKALEKQRLARALRESEERYRLVTEHITDAVFFLDMEGRLVFGNSRGGELTGYRVEELLGAPIVSLLTPEGAREAQARLDAVRAGQEVAPSFETQLVRKGGGLVWVEANLTSVTKDGKVIGCLGAARDITERKLAEQALREANQALTGLVADLEQRNREMALLSEMGELLQGCHTSGEAYSVVRSFGQRLFPAESGMLAVLNATNTFAEVVAHWGESGPAEPVFAPDQCWALRRGRAHVVGDPESGPVCGHLDPPKSTGYLCIPMLAQGSPMGILHLRDRPATGQELGGLSDRLKEFRQRLAIGMAEHVALALGNLRLQEMLRNQVIRDPVTGLFNRRYMTESLEREVHRAIRNQTPLGIVMLDIDNFKPLNDRLGHDAGDRLLRALGEFLRTHTRGHDIACRYGGDEFTLILPGASLDVTRRRAEQLREEFKRLRVKYPDPALGGVTLSMGVATFPDHGSSWEVVLQEADAALYRAKRDGRDRVACSARSTQQEADLDPAT